MSRDADGAPVSVPDDLRYSSDHEWARLEDGLVRIGITDYAQDALGDVVFVQVPSVGTEVKAGEAFSEVESTKSVSDIYAPISGTIVEVNTDLADEPQRVNEDPYGDGWLCVINPADGAEFDALLDAAGYQALVDG
jgi:glycine cleavage system H protein